MTRSPEVEAVTSYLQEHPGALQNWKRMNDDAEKLLAEEGKSTSFVFISPSKRKPKRASLTRVTAEDGDPAAAAHPSFKVFLSDWERKYDVNNLVS